MVSFARHDLVKIGLMYVLVFDELAFMTQSILMWLALFFHTFKNVASTIPMPARIFMGRSNGDQNLFDVVTGIRTSGVVVVAPHIDFPVTLQHATVMYLFDLNCSCLKIAIDCITHENRFNSNYSVGQPTFHSKWMA